MTSKDKARLEELEAEECLVDGEDIIDYFRLSCEKLGEENEELKAKNEELGQQLAYECGCNAQLVELQEENEKLKKAIHKAIELLSIDGKGTKQQVKKLLSEVVENEI